MPLLGLFCWYGLYGEAFEVSDDSSRLSAAAEFSSYNPF